MSSTRGFWRKCRIAFRCARFMVWGAALLALLAAGWLNVVGLPDFLKTRLVAALHERGVDLAFTRMRWRLVHGLICDNVRVGEAKNAGGPVLAAREVQLRLNYRALLHRRLEVDGLVVRQGNFFLPLPPTNSLALTNLQTELRFAKDDVWTLDQFRAELAGAHILLAGEISHAPEFRNWKMFSGAPNTDRGSVETSLKNFSEALNQIHFDGQPQLNVKLDGDARDVHTFRLQVNARVPGVQTPWFSATDLKFTGRVSAPPEAPTSVDAAWGFWTNLQPFHVEWSARAENLQSSLGSALAAECAGTWRAPEAAVPRLSARLGGGQMNAAAELNVATRELSFTNDSNFDPHAVAALLTGKARARLAQISWKQPPQVRVGGSLKLPPWTNPPPGWRDDLEPGLRLNGELAFTNALIADMAPLDSARARFSCSNRVWHLSDAELAQGNSTLELAGEADESANVFRCVLGGKLDAASVQPFLRNTNAARGFSHLHFREPVALVLDARGTLTNFDTLAATGRVLAANFAIRGQWIDSLTATLCYTNRTAEFFHPELSRAAGAEHFAAEKVTLDIAGEKLILRNGRGHVTPTAVAEAIGPKTAKAMEPYHFLSVPDATVDGCIPLKQRNGEVVPDAADLWFDVVGTAPFRWKRFETPAITGRIHWIGGHLVLTNVVGKCYSGEAHGWGDFDVQTPGDGTDFSFFISGTNADFNAMGRALWSPTNQLRGNLSGTLMVTRANSDDWRTWNGHGNAELHDGVIWDAPVFGLMSLVLNALSPGLDIGNNRATDGAGRFTMTNGVIYTDSLDIRSLTMRLQYVGTVDLEENISARAKAQLLRNTPMIGSIFSTVLWPVSKVCECQVAGTLDKPKITPIYIPGILLAPFHPIRSMERLFASPTNDAPEKP